MAAGGKLKIFADAGAEIYYASAPTASNVKTHFDNSKWDQPLFPFAATAQVRCTCS